MSTTVVVESVVLNYNHVVSQNKRLLLLNSFLAVMTIILNVEIIIKYGVQVLNVLLNYQ